jgi:transposase-like protein
MGTSVEHTMAAQIGTQGSRTRMRRSMQEKLQIVQETLSDVSVAVVARRHGVNANQVFAWRRQYQRGELGARAGNRAAEAVIVPVRVAAAPQAREPSSAIETGVLPEGSPRIEIELAEGPRLKIWDISSETLRAIIRDLMRPC